MLLATKLEQCLTIKYSGVKAWKFLKRSEDVARVLVRKSYFEMQNGMTPKQIFSIRWKSLFQVVLKKQIDQGNVKAVPNNIPDATRNQDKNQTNRKMKKNIKEMRWKPPIENRNIPIFTRQRSL